MKKYLLIIYIHTFCLVALWGAKPGDTIAGMVSEFDSLSSDRKSELIVDGQLAHAAYSDGKIPDGYRAATTAEFNKYIGSVSDIVYTPILGQFYSKGFWTGSGLAGSLLVNKETGEVVLSFRGTESFLGWDAINDFTQGIGYTPEQYDEASEMLANLIRNTETSQTKIKVVGHSLGGGLATYATLHNNTERVTTTTFNPAGIHPYNIIGSNLNKAANKITNIRITNDPVSVTGLLIGNTYEVSNLFDSYIDGTFDKIWSSGNSHRLRTVMAYMELSYKKSLQNEQQDSESSDMTSYPESDTSDNNVVTPDNSNEKDDISSGNNVSSGGDVPSGDLTRYPENSVSGDRVVVDQTGSDNSNNTPSGDDVSSVLTDTQIDWGSNSNNSSSMIGTVVEKIKDNSPVVEPNIPHYRILWMFSGENWGDVAGAVVENAFDIFKNGNFSSIANKISDEMGFKEMKEALRSIGD